MNEPRIQVNVAMNPDPSNEHDIQEPEDLTKIKKAIILKHVFSTQDSM